MPDKRKHRGTAPGDLRIFGDQYHADLSQGVADLSMLLTKGYPLNGSLKLVGDRFALTERQRLALRRCACSDRQQKNRTSRRVEITDLKDKPLVIDGFNLLITAEAALSGGAIFIARDGCFRDLSGIHGSYRRVTETLAAFDIIADFLTEAHVSKVQWLFDRPVSNSGKLKVMIEEMAAGKDWPWQVELLDNPDNALIASENIIATSDSDVIDKCKKWINLSAEIVKRCKQPNGTNPFTVDLSHK